MDFSGIRVLSFDCYGTLIDWESGILAALAPWRARSGVAADGEELLAAFARHEGVQETATPALAYPRLLARVLESMGAELGAAATPEEARAFGASVGDWPAFADSAAALARLKRHHALAILSNVDRASFARSNSRLGVAFDLVCTAEDIGSYKPAPANFTYLLARLDERGFAPETLLHVAQSLFHDHAPAKAMGLKTAWIDRRGGKPGGATAAIGAGEARPDHRFESLAALAAALAAGDD